MRIGFGVFLFTVGAILAFATNWHPSGFNVQMTGAILMLVGVVWAGMGIALYRSGRHSAIITRRRRLDEPTSSTGEVVYEEQQSIDGSVSTHQPGIYDEVIHPGQAVTYPKPEVLEDPPSPYNDPYRSSS
jgi:hypothetical protein